MFLSKTFFFKNSPTFFSQSCRRKIMTNLSNARTLQSCFVLQFVTTKHFGQWLGACMWFVQIVNVIKILFSFWRTFYHLEGWSCTLHLKKKCFPFLQLHACLSSFLCFRSFSSYLRSKIFTHSWNSSKSQTLSPLSSTSSISSSTSFSVTSRP